MLLPLDETVPEPFAVMNGVTKIVSRQKISLKKLDPQKLNQLEDTP